ncbi:translation initiation factor IF-2 [Caviibacter abscessus]|uniref:translation initiation factor IF-2 n=1 Tax=Caviibacter abscessus TaxID=1766719 RepID=UPI000837B895|nr:translation initiation factor IF-2 [Caviibacter abscessus]
MGNRVYDYAKKFALDTTTFIKKLAYLGINDKTALNKLDEKEIELIEKNMSKLIESKGKEEKSKEIMMNEKDKKVENVVQEKMVFTHKKRDRDNKDTNKFNNEKRMNRNNEQKFQKKEQFGQNQQQPRNIYQDNKENNGERKQFYKPNNRDNKDNKDNRNFNNGYRENREQKDFKDRYNRDQKDNKDRNFNKDNNRNRSFNKDNNFSNSKQSFNNDKKTSVAIPEPESSVSKNAKKTKQKFDKKKYENEKKSKEEERKLKELRTDFRKDDVKKKTKKKDKVLKNEIIKIDENSGMIKISNEISTKELAEKLGVNVSEIIKKFFMQGKMLTANSILSMNEIEEVALEYNVLVEQEEIEEISFGEKYKLEIEDRSEDLITRAPVITIMGHVDHGKTSLLDALRHTNVISSEAGGITQSIGAYQVEWKGQKITFIDTPGHEAFTEMRARGANITDISILIVAADDGVKPQTVEAISHAKEANVPIIVAINKIDKPSANPAKVKQELMEYGLICTEWGGDTEFVEISAKQKLNLEELLETILLTAELLELKANPKKRAKAVIVESKLDPQVGAIADILIQEGELKIGDIFVAGQSHGKVRTMVDDKGNKITKALPSTPVEITGFNELPEAGALIYCVQNDKQARKIIEDYKNNVKTNDMNNKKHISLESLSKELEDQQLKELKCIIRADTKGSAEALKESLLKLSNDKVSINIIQSSAGAITEGDVKLAEASNAIIIGFSVRPTTTARNEAEKTGVEIRNYNVIYHVTEDIEKAMKGMLDPEYKEIYHGRIEVKQVFKISNVGNIAGALVVDGKITKNSKIRVLRNGIIVFEGEILSLKRYKDDVKEANIGQDCGISIKDFNDIKEDDIIEAYTLEEIAR